MNLPGALGGQCQKGGKKSQMSIGRRGLEQTRARNKLASVSGEKKWASGPTKHGLEFPSRSSKVLGCSLNRTKGRPARPLPLMPSMKRIKISWRYKKLRECIFQNPPPHPRGRTAGVGRVLC